MNLRLIALASLLAASASTAASILAPPAPLAKELQQYVRVPGGRIALTGQY